MTRTIPIFFKACLLVVVFANPLEGLASGNGIKTSSVLVDEEYDRYKKRGDEFFTQGNYERAKAQYENCLEVPGFVQDIYAKQRIDLCSKALALRKQATELVQAGRGKEALKSYQQLLGLNAADPVTKAAIADYWSEDGNRLYAVREYAAAKTSYQEALRYAERKDLLLIQVQNCDQFLSLQVPNESPAPVKTEPVQSSPATAKVPSNSSGNTFAQPVVERRTRKLGLKVATALVSVGSGLYAFRLRSDYQDKLNTLNSLAKSVDPDDDKLIINASDYDRWQTAYAAAENARNKQGLFYAMTGTAVAAALLEVYLITHKPKIAKVLSFQPTSGQIGLALKRQF